MNLLDCLQTVPGFSQLPYEDLEYLDRSMVVAEFPDGHEFIHEGAKANDIFLLLDGEVSVTHKKEDTGEPLELQRLHPGEFFGLIALIDHGRRAASCAARGPVRVASLPYTAFSLLYDTNGILSHAFLTVAADQLTHDFRELIGLVRQAVFARDAGENQRAARKLIRAYHGPERRSGGGRRDADVDSGTGARGD